LLLIPIPNGANGQGGVGRAEAMIKAFHLIATHIRRNCLRKASILHQLVSLDPIQIDVCAGLAFAGALGRDEDKIAFAYAFAPFSDGVFDVR
jgi:hypothetical protein